MIDDALEMSNIESKDEETKNVSLSTNAPPILQ